ncbi:MAG: hypothetical protein AABW85_02515 [archaeon]
MENLKTIDLKTIDQKIEFAARKEIEAKIKENMLNGKKTRGGILEEKKVPIIDSAIKKNIALVLLGALVLAVMAVNLSMQSGVSDRMDKMQNTISLMSILGSGTAAVPQGNSGGAAPVLGASPADMQALFAEIIPKGVPEIYGGEIGVSFDNPVESMKVLSNFDGDLYPSGKYKVSQLTDSQKQRYIKIGSGIACEFCCGATTLVARDGKPACGCAHSAAMRGLAMHLLINHENEMSDDQILAELTKWKTMFFPKEMVQKAIELKAQNGEISPSTVSQLPEQVGGC